MGIPAFFSRLGMSVIGSGSDAIWDFTGDVRVNGMPIAGVLPGRGKVFFLDPTNGSDSYDGKSPSKAKATLEAAYALTTSGRNDTILYLAGTSGLNLSAAFTWSKSYTHLIGVCAPTNVAQRARIFQLSSLTGASPLITISGSGCIFQNLYIFQGVNDNTSLINVCVTGGRNYFRNVHFAGGGHATMAITGSASLKLDAAEENLFEDCNFGVDTIGLGTGGTTLLFDSEAHRNTFKNCRFTLWSGHAGATFVKVADATGIDRYNEFVNCRFYNTGTTMTEAFSIPAITGPRVIPLYNCGLYGATDWDANDRGVLKLNNGTITGGGNAGIFAASAAT